jgi:hypothetical protein
MIDSLNEAATPSTRVARPVVLSATSIFAVVMLGCGVALWAELDGPGWVAMWALAAGVVAMAASGWVFFRPRRWKALTLVVGLMSLVSIVIFGAAIVDMFLDPGAHLLPPDGRAFAVGIGLVTAIWATFVGVVVAMDRRRRGPDAAGPSHRASKGYAVSGL